MKRKPTPLERCAEELPKMLDPCPVCKFIDKNRLTHHDNIKVCQSCCWYYLSQFKERKR
jgi:hypothetical protein